MIRIRKFGPVLAVAIACAAFLAQPAFGQVPPRFYWKSLIGGRAVPVIGMSLSGNANPIDPALTVSPEASFEATVALVGYGHTFTLFDRAAMAAVLVPVGRISGGASISGLTLGEDASGFGDPLFEIDINLIGPKPIRNIPDLMRYEPGFSLDVLVDLTFPIGEYDSEEPLNLGQNRWYGRVGAPIVWQLGPWVPGRRTTLEFLPSLWLYGDNDDFVGRRLSTDPMFQLESHFTRDLAEHLWAVGKYKIFLKPSALKEIESIDNKQDRCRIVNRIRSLSDDPRPPGCEKLSSADKFRVRPGRYRIVYSVRDEALVVDVVKVAHRKDVYR